MKGGVVKGERCWIAERCSRARKTLLVYANSREEAQSKLDLGEGEGVEGVDVMYYSIGRAKIIREERSHTTHNKGVKR